jgi:hypothetical protein
MRPLESVPPAAVAGDGLPGSHGPSRRRVESPKVKLRLTSLDAGHCRRASLRRSSPAGSRRCSIPLPRARRQTSTRLGAASFACHDPDGGGCTAWRSSPAGSRRRSIPLPCARRQTWTRSTAASFACHAPDGGGCTARASATGALHPWTAGVEPAICHCPHSLAEFHAPRFPVVRCARGHGGPVVTRSGRLRRRSPERTGGMWAAAQRCQDAMNSFHFLIM